MYATAAIPDAYVEALSGWQRERVEMLRAAVNAGGDFSALVTKLVAAAAALNLEYGGQTASR